MTRTQFLNVSDLPAKHLHGASGREIPSDSSFHYVSPEEQLGHQWPVDKKDAPDYAPFCLGNTPILLRGEPQPVPILMPGQQPPSGWQVVTYQRPQLPERYERERRAALHNRAQEIELIKSDPYESWKFEKTSMIRRTVARLRRDPRYSTWTRKELWKYVKGYLGNADEPVIIRNPRLQAKADAESKSQGAQRRGRGGQRALAIERRAEQGNLEQKDFSQDFIDQIKDTRSRRTINTADGERPMTQEDLAKLVNVNVNVIRDFEAGKLPFDGPLKSLLIWKLGIAVE